MQFALVDGQRAAARKGLAGVCPACGQLMIARCGTERLHHWAHRGALSCDPWWERETDWHRQWKSRFPALWQEVVRAEGEKHIADVHTAHGLTIEFQHSPISVAERVSREAFYGNMVWVVDGGRLKRDAGRLIKAMEASRAIPGTALCLLAFPEEAFSAGWLSSSVPVFFDFALAEVAAEDAGLRELLWCLLPGRAGQFAVVLAVAREDFLRCCLTMPEPVGSRALLGEVRGLLQESQRRNTTGPAVQLGWRRRAAQRRPPRF